MLSIVVQAIALHKEERLLNSYISPAWRPNKVFDLEEAELLKADKNIVGYKFWLNQILKKILISWKYDN